jgi:hypothetical protein
LASAVDDDGASLLVSLCGLLSCGGGEEGEAALEYDRRAAVPTKQCRELCSHGDLEMRHSAGAMCSGLAMPKPNVEGSGSTASRRRAAELLHDRIVNSRDCELKKMEVKMIFFVSFFILCPRPPAALARVMEYAGEHASLPPVPPRDDSNLNVEETLAASSSAMDHYEGNPASAAHDSYENQRCACSVPLLRAQLNASAVVSSVPTSPSGQLKFEFEFIRNLRFYTLHEWEWQRDSGNTAPHQVL